MTLPAPARAGRAPRAALPRAQDPQERAVPPLMADQRDFAAFLRRLRTLLFVLAAIVALGTLGLVVTEDVGVWRGFIWTLDILATVGSIPAPETVAGQIVKVALIVLGVGTLFYGLVTVTEVFVSGHLADLLQERRAQKLIDATSDHYIICGFGRVGRQVARDLRAAGARYVVVDHNPEMRDHAQGDRRALHRGRAVRRRGPARRRRDARPRRHRLRRLRRRQHLHHAHRPRPAARHRDRRARVGGGRRGQAPARRRDARDLAVQDERRRDGPPRAATPRSAARSRSRRSTGMEEIEVAAGLAPARASAIGDVRGGAIIVGVRDATGTVPPPALGGDRPARRRRRDGDGDRAHDGAPRGACSPRPGRGPGRDADRGTARRRRGGGRRAGQRRLAALAPDARAPQAGRPRRLRDERRARARAGVGAPPRDVAERLGDALQREPRRGARPRRGRGPRASSTSSSPTAGTPQAVDWVLEAGDAFGAARARARPSASTSSSSRPTRPAR